MKLHIFLSGDHTTYSSRYASNPSGSGGPGFWSGKQTDFLSVLKHLKTAANDSLLMTLYWNQY